MGQLVMLAQEGGGAEGCSDGSGDGQADQVIGAGGGIGLLGRFFLFGGANDDDGAGVIGGGRFDLGRWLGLLQSAFYVCKLCTPYAWNRLWWRLQGYR